MSEAIVEGRYPLGISFYPENMQASAVMKADGTVVVRVDDAGNPDFWMQVIVEPKYEAPDEEGTGIDGALARLRVLRSMLERAPIMKGICDRAIAALEATNA
jgi:hypothetical protein